MKAEIRKLEYVLDIRICDCVRIFSLAYFCLHVERDCTPLDILALHFSFHMKAEIRK